MGKLRDMFAFVGFCESTSDLAAKPALVEQVIAFSKPYANTQNDNADSSYEDRMRTALGQASSYALNRLLQEKVIVCMDRRLSQLKEGFFDSSIYSAFYNQDGVKTLGLYDNGKIGSFFFDRGIADYSGDVIDELVSDYLDRKETSPLILGYTHHSPATKTTCFDWEDQDYFGSELRKNPQMLNPPLRKSTAANLHPTFK